MNRARTLEEARWQRVGAPLAARAEPVAVEDTTQYSLRKIVAIWAAAALPMALLGWVVAPIVGDRLDLGVGDANREAFTRAGLLTLGLIWQFILVMAIIWREEGSLGWSKIRERCRLNAPQDPRSGEKRGRLWLWLVPAILLFGALQMAPIQDLWEKAFPFLGEPGRYSFDAIMNSADRKAALEGAWQVFGLFLVLGVFNTVLGEELLFRGILLPKMQGAFGKRDWLANGVLFGLYHLHQPWSIPGSIIDGTFCHALPARRFQSTWLAIVTHSTQTVFFSLLALGLVLGVA